MPYDRLRVHVVIRTVLAVRVRTVAKLYTDYEHEQMYAASSRSKYAQLENYWHPL